MYTQLGVLSKGTVIECNVRYAPPQIPSPSPVSVIAENHHLTLISELGMVTAGGKVVWGRYAQITVRSPSLLSSLIHSSAFLLRSLKCILIYMLQLIYILRKE